MSANDKPGLATPCGTSRLRLRVLSENLQVARMSHFGKCELWSHGQSDVKVVASTRVLRNLLRSEGFSNHYENGGFLVGRAYLDLDGAATSHIITLTATPRAAATRASALHFTYTADSFAQLRHLLHEKFPGQQLLGWYHTHLFAADDDLGLSDVDLQLHFSTFKHTWQVAGLINLELGETTTLRFYAVKNGTMQLCSLYHVFSEEDLITPSAC